LQANKTKQEETDPNAIQQILVTLNQINDKLETILELNQQLLKINQNLLQIADKKEPPTEINKEPDVMALLNLPLALRKTILVLYKLEKATADEIAKETSRLRAVESAAANALVRMGYVKKKREGRDVFFYIENPEEKKTYG
jgi:hypothetical protein